MRCTKLLIRPIILVISSRPARTKGVVKVNIPSRPLGRQTGWKPLAEGTLRAKTTALLLQDLQNELIEGIRPVVPLSGPQLIANCQKPLTKARAVGMPVIYVRVSRRPDLRDVPRPPWVRRPAGAGHPASSKAPTGWRSSRSWPRARRTSWPPSTLRRDRHNFTFHMIA
jgi:hypothetical protein